MVTPRARHFLALGLAWFGATLGAARAVPSQHEPPGQVPAKQAPSVPELAVIVNSKNPTTGLTFAELRSHCRLELQFWSNNQRTQLYLRPSETPEMKILLDQVFSSTPRDLRKYWIGRVFRGEIPAVPTVVPTAAAAIARVRDNEGAFSVVLATDVPEGVRVLAIDGKRPGEPGYALKGRADSEQPKHAEGQSPGVTRAD